MALRLFPATSAGKTWEAPSVGSSLIGSSGGGGASATDDRGGPVRDLEPDRDWDRLPPLRPEPCDERCRFPPLWLPPPWPLRCPFEPWRPLEPEPEPELDRLPVLAVAFPPPLLPPLFPPERLRLRLRFLLRFRLAPPPLLAPPPPLALLPEPPDPPPPDVPAPSF
jgi:hypothetical protein